jgi:dipeptidyl aminopeptidase/acylaminoacyl peptidase
VLYAVRSSYTDPGSIVAVSTRDATSTVLPAPVSYPELPGRLENVETVAADGARVRGYLLLPEGASEAEPAPLLLWIHGGPLGSWNAWSWRWCPWLMVAQGYAVLLPDPALSTGYGLDFIQRGWGSWGGAPYTDLMAITDQVAQRSDIDHSRTAAMGGSFGGYMANWVAGHTDRFSAIVSHASLWNLESFGPTTDASWYWARELSAQMQAEHSPHRHAENITTPMLVIHGDKDYRVPISEGLALWWSLVSGYQGAPEKLPHKFLYFPDENHWILTPQHSVVWYQTVLAFLQAHLGDGNFARPETL